MELAPFGKLLYSSDAFGLPELYLLGAHTFRVALAEVLDGEGGRRRVVRRSTPAGSPELACAGQRAPGLPDGGP